MYVCVCVCLYAIYKVARANISAFMSAQLQLDSLTAHHLLYLLLLPILISASLTLSLPFSLSPMLFESASTPLGSALFMDAWLILYCKCDE